MRRSAGDQQFNTLSVADARSPRDLARSRFLSAETTAQEYSTNQVKDSPAVGAVGERSRDSDRSRGLVSPIYDDGAVRPFSSSLGVSAAAAASISSLSPRRART